MTQTKPPWGPPRPTAFNGVMMRSRMEAGFAQWADANGLGVDYEPCAFAGAAGQYLPDFRLRYVEVQGIKRATAHDGVVWVEVKPVLPDGNDLLALQERMEIVFESEPDAVLAIVYKDPAPGLVVRRRYAWREAAWGITTDASYNLGVVFPYTDRECLPWPDGYWMGQDGGDEE